MAFQVVDDLLDVSADAEVVGKPVGNDLRSGVLTLPILHLLRSQGYQGEAASLVAKGADMTPADIDRVLKLVRENGAVDYAFPGRAKLCGSGESGAEGAPGQRDPDAPSSDRRRRADPHLLTSLPGTLPRWTTEALVSP